MFLRRLSQPLSLPALASAQPPLPKSTFPQSRPSLSSKFAAHYIGTKSRKRPLSPRPSTAKHVNGTVSDTQAVPRNRSRKSSDSDSSTTSGRGTPRTGPAITVSLSPDNLDDYKDLFTLPRRKGPPATGISSTPASEYRDLYHDGASSVTLTPGTSTKSETKSPPTMAEIARREARQLAEGRVSSPLVKSATRRVTAVMLPDPDDSAAEVESMGSAPIIDRQCQPSIRTSSLPRSLRSSRLRSPSTVAGKERSPPSIPLPLPPTPNPPPPQSPQSLSQPSVYFPSSATSVSEGLRRPRANTMGNVPPSAASLGPLTRPFSELPVDNLSVIAVPNDEILDIDQMTPDQLKQTLKSRINQYDELAVRFLEVTEAYAVEKIALENRVRALEMEAARKDREIQGFTWRLNNRGVSSGAPPLPTSPNHASSQLSLRALQASNADDSGAESHQTSGAESISGPTETSLPIPKEKVRRTRVPGDANYALFGTLTLPTHSGFGSEPELRNGKKTTFYSLTPSASSSTSSLPPPLNGNLSASSLSSIPESGNAPLDVRRSFSAAERDDDVSGQSRRISTSSASSTSAASSAYSANLKRGRPASIAQVLNKVTKADNGLGTQPLTVATSAIQVITTSL